MSKFNKIRFIKILLSLSLSLFIVIAMPIISMAATATLETVNLRTTVNFAVLAGEKITNTGSTTISGSIPEGGGNVGLFPGTSFPGQADVIMTGWTAHLADTVASVAKNDLILAYDDAAGRTPTTTLTETDNQLGGKTLTSGVYAFGHADTANLTASEPLILDAEGNENAVFVFQASSDFVTASGSEIILINGARFCRVFWQVTSSATLGTYSHFVGHIFALTSITADTGATVQGQLLARNGSVVLRNNTITNGICNNISPSSNAVSRNSNTDLSSSNTDLSSSNTDLSSNNASFTNEANPETGDSLSMLLRLLALVTISVITAIVFNKKTPKK